MKRFSFPYFATFADGDTGEGYLDYELSDEQVALILKLQKEDGLFATDIELLDYPELEEAGRSLYTLAEEDTIRSCEENGWFDGYDEEEAAEERETVFGSISYTVRIPEELECNPDK